MIREALCVRCQSYTTVWAWFRGLGAVCYRCSASIQDTDPANTPYTWEVVNTATTNSESVFASREAAERRLAELPDGFAVVAFDHQGHAVANQDTDPAKGES